MIERNTLIAIACLIFFFGSNAQVTQIELISGPNKSDFTAISFNPIHSNERFTITTMAFFQKYHGSEDIIFDEAGLQSTFYWNINPRISVGTGLYHNSEAGFSERLSILYKIRLPNFILSVIPTVARAEQTGFINGDLFLQMQLTKDLNQDLKLLFSAQVLTNWDKFSNHTRSFQQVRAGLTRQSLQYGLAVDFDQYGDVPISITSLGVFLRKIFEHKNYK